jgi:hypothetical protein
MSHYHKNFITTVIDLYGLELEDHQVDSLIETWLQKYDDSWIVKAIVESLYRGRYKIKSVDNILKDWHRLGKPRYNFTPEYEREILQNLPALTDFTANSPPLTAEPEPEPELSIEPDLDANFPKHQPPALSSEHLNPEESAPFQYHNHSIPPDRSTNSALGVIVTVEEPKVADGDCLDTSCSDKYHSFIYVPTSLAILQGKVYVSRERQNHLKADRIIAHPVKLQLFHTLKAIVDPNNHHQAEVDTLPVEDTNTNLPHYTHFHLPIEEQYL